MSDPAILPAASSLQAAPRSPVDWNLLLKLGAAGSILAMLFTLVLVRLMPAGEFELVAVAALAPLGVHLMGRPGDLT